MSRWILFYTISYLRGSRTKNCWYEGVEALSLLYPAPPRRCGRDRQRPCSSYAWRPLTCFERRSAAPAITGCSAVSSWCCIVPHKICVPPTKVMAWVYVCMMYSRLSWIMYNSYCLVNCTSNLYVHLLCWKQVLRLGIIYPLNYTLNFGRGICLAMLL
jgi:hypothetical protein